MKVFPKTKHFFFFCIKVLHENNSKFAVQNVNKSTWPHETSRLTNDVNKKKTRVNINIESLMSCHLLLNLLHELANMILCEALPSIISFLPTNVINLVINDNEFEILFIT